jgi:hypothetical protein
MRIRAKLGLGFGAILALLAIVGMTGIYQLDDVIQGCQGNVTVQWELMETADTMVSDVLQVRRSEKDFLMRKDMKYPDRVNKYLDTAQIEPPPSIGTRLKTEFLRGMGNHNDAFVMILDIDKVFSSEELNLVQEMNYDKVHSGC